MKQAWVELGLTKAESCTKKFSFKNIFSKKLWSKTFLSQKYLAQKNLVPKKNFLKSLFKKIKNDLKRKKNVSKNNLVQKSWSKSNFA